MKTILDNPIFAETAIRLMEITKDCRDDMHEPDEQGLYALVKGSAFDNAYGDDPKYGDIVVTLIQDNGDGHPVTEHFNLANLIALARLGIKNDKELKLLRMNLRNQLILLSQLVDRAKNLLGKVGS